MRSVQRRAQSFWIMFMYASMSLYGGISPHICGCSKKSLLTVTFWIILRWDFHFSIMFKISIVFCSSLRRDLLNRLMMLFRWRNSHILGHFISRTIIFKVVIFHSVRPNNDTNCILSYGNYFTSLTSWIMRFSVGFWQWIQHILMMIVWLMYI